VQHISTKTTVDRSNFLNNKHLSSHSKSIYELVNQETVTELGMLYLYETSCEVRSRRRNHQNNNWNEF